MILADENVHGQIIKALRVSGFEVVSVREKAPGTKDEDVIKMALRENYILLTEDKDFGEWVFAHHIQGLTVVFLRYTFQDVEAIISALLTLLNSRDLEPLTFATLTTKKIRLRKL